LDLHVVSVHLKSGQERRDHELRLRSLASFQGVAESARSAHFDDDIVIGGDLNTMGCRHCSPKLTATQELELFARELGRGVPAWSFVAPRTSCSEYHAGSGALLDHFVVSAGLLSEAAESRVTGYCEDRGCRPFDAPSVPAAYRSLSDHCPVLLELPDRDDDQG
jgi:exonuclease III